MPTDPEIVDRLTNALQSALMLAARLEPDLRQAARDAAQLSSKPCRRRRQRHTNCGRTRADRVDAHVRDGRRPPWTHTPLAASSETSASPRRFANSRASSSRR